MMNLTAQGLLIFVLATYLTGWLMQHMNAKSVTQPAVIMAQMQRDHQTLSYAKPAVNQPPKPRLFVALHQCSTPTKKQISREVWHPCQQPRKKIVA